MDIGRTIAYSKGSKIMHGASTSDQMGAVPDASFSQHCVACQGIGVTRKKKKAPYNTNLYGITTWVGCGLVGVMQVLARCAFFFAGAMLF